MQLQKDAFIDQAMRRIPAAPPNCIQIATLNKRGSHEGINPADLEAGANRRVASRPIVIVIKKRR